MFANVIYYRQNLANNVGIETQNGGLDGGLETQSVGFNVGIKIDYEARAILTVG